MPSNNSGLQVGYLHGKYGERMGWLISPRGWRRPPPWMPMCLDNGAYGAFLKGKPFSEVEEAWLELIETAHEHCQPDWMVVPDVVTKKQETLDSWAKWYPFLKEKYPKTPLAFAVQDGMTPDDVPKEGVSVIFIGGSTEFKWGTLKIWCDAFPRVHVARVNTERWLWVAHFAGVESCDGTGWFRGDKKQLAGLYNYMELSS